MHIAFITPEYPHPKASQAAGIGTSVKNLVSALIQKGERVTVFVYHQKKSKIIEDSGLTIHLIASKKHKILSWYFYRKQLQNYINKVVLKVDIDVIEAPDWTGITAFMRLKAPLVIRFHGSDAYFCKLEGRKQKFKNFIFEKQALKSASFYIAPTTFAGTETANIFGLNQKKIKTIYNGVQLNQFINATPSIFQPKTLLYVGTIIRKKGVFELAEIFNKLVEKEPDAKLVLIGSDSQDIKTGNASTYGLIKSIFTYKAKANVSYLGKIAYEEVQQHIKKAHVCAFPSFAETFGMVTIESMALQKPVVNTNLGWSQELIDDGINGFLVHPSDIETYSDTILSLFENEALCLQIGKAAREKVEESFDISIIATKSLDYYKYVIAQKYY